MVKNLVERYGEVVVAKSFEHDNGLDYVTLVVVEADDDQLWNHVVDEVNDCESSFDASTGDNVVLTTEVAVEPADGPKVGDDTQWFETTVNLSSNVTGANSSNSRAILARSGDYVVQVMASALDDGEKVDLVEAALGS